MKTIETKPGVTIGFVDSEEFDITMHGDYVIGRLSEITEEQAKELVASTKWHFPEEHTVWFNYTESAEQPNPVSGQLRQKWNVGLSNAVDSLKTAAISVGIEEKDFDKYLVIKL